MLSGKVMTRIRNHSWGKHSNQSLLLGRIKKTSVLAIKQMTILAKDLPEEQKKEIFTADLLRPFIREILEPKNTRTILVTEMMSYLITQKLFRELPLNMVNNLQGDIGKTWTYAQLLAEYADKPLTRQPKSKTLSHK